jgi:hypothetical protein
MIRKTTGWKRARALLLPGMFLAGLPASACKDAAEEACGPCGEIQYGDVSISGSAQLDGFFGAVNTLTTATASIDADYQANLTAIGEAFGAVKADGSVNVDDVVKAIKAEFTAKLQGGIKVVYAPPQCQANVDIAIDATAKCEAKADCEVSATPPKAEVKCEGSCTGSCEGSCSGTLKCEATAGNIKCDGACEGSCQLTAAGACNGTCHGDCSGTCEVRDSAGKCAGKCEGNCSGSCELAVSAKCEGTCSGKCTGTPPSAGCEGEAKCEGKCEGSCSGGCEGSFTPPSASANCEASADCQAQASAQANASLECTPPRLDISYGFKAGVNAAAQADFLAKIAVLKARGQAIIQGSARLSALVDGTVEGKVVYEVSPLDGLVASLKGFASADAIAKFDIPAGRIACVVPAFVDAGKALGDAASKVGGTIEGQAKIVAVLKGG